MVVWLRQVLLALIALPIMLEAQASPRVALVIGNAKYQAGALPPLGNPVNDAVLMEETLKAVGFDVVRLIDASEDQMEKAIREFGQRLKAAGPEAVGLFYYSGHGVQSDGENYMVPVDADVQTIEDVESEAPRLGLVIRQMDRASNAANFIILDACRNNTLPSESRSGERGLKSIRAPASANLFIAYATRPGAVAADGLDANSPYTQALVRLMKSEAAPAVNMFLRVGAAVRDATGNRQQPWTENGLADDAFCFRECSPAEMTCARATAPAVIYFKPRSSEIDETSLRTLEDFKRRALSSQCRIKRITVLTVADVNPDSPGNSNTPDTAFQRSMAVTRWLVSEGFEPRLLESDSLIANSGAVRGRPSQVVLRRAELQVVYEVAQAAEAQP